MKNPHLKLLETYYCSCNDILKIGGTAIICREKKTKNPYKVIEGYAFKRINLTEL